MLFTANLTNQPLPPLGGPSRRPQGVIHIERTRFLWEDRLYERHAAAPTIGRERGGGAAAASSSPPTSATCSRCAATRRPARGEPLPAAGRRPTRSLLPLRRPRRRRARQRHRLLRAAAPARARTRAEFLLSAARRTRAAELYVEVGLRRDGPTPSRARFRAAAARARFAHARRAAAAAPRSAPPAGCSTTGSSKSRADLALLTTELPTGPYPYAGIPWFSTAFGRDAIITALQMLWLDPSLARGRADLPRRATRRRETSAFQRRGARQDHARDPQGRDGGAARAAVRPLLRRRRHDAAVRDAGRRLRATAPATWRFIDELWPALRAAVGWIEDARRRQPRRLRRLRPRRDERARQPGLEGQPGFGLPRRRPRSPPGRSRWSRCRATSTPRSAPWRSSRTGAASRSRRRTGSARGRAPAGRGRGSGSGCEDAGLLRASRSTATASRAGCAPPTPGTCCSPACRRRSGPARRGRSCWRRTSTRGWGMRTLAAGRGALQPDVLPQRLGLAARHGALRARGCRATASATAWCALMSGMFETAVAASTCACRSCSAASRAPPARRRSPIRSPACRRPGRRGRSSCCCRPASA